MLSKLIDTFVLLQEDLLNDLKLSLIALCVSGKVVFFFTSP